MKFTPADLQSQISGEVLAAPDALDYFSTDGSVFKIRPQAVVYPRNTSDVQKVVKYLSEQARSGNHISLVARGKGTDQAGGALGSGLMMIFPSHMNKLRRLDKTTVTVQPGILYKDLQNTLHSHGRFLPPYPSSIDFSTIGGAVANNACGEKTLKYGATRDYVDCLRVVLSDGSVIETRKLSARELSRKKAQTDFEGEIYRKLDALLEDNADLIKGSSPKVTKNAAGYALGRVRGDDGSFDLSQILVGSQGTLGVITEIRLRTMPFNPHTSLIVGHFDSLEKAEQAVLKLLPLAPSALEVVDSHLLAFLQRTNPAQLAGLIPEKLPAITLLIEFDDQSQLRQTVRTRRTLRIIKKLTFASEVATKPADQERLWKIRRSAAAVIWQGHGTKKALPIIEDGVVPVAKFSEFLHKVYKILGKYKLEIAVWGHAGNGNFHMQPFMDLTKASDRNRIFNVMDDFYNMVIKMGGSTSGEHNDGILRAPYLKKLYGNEMYQLFRDVNAIFDPQDILNPEKIVHRTKEELKPLLRHEYSMAHLYDHMPHN